MVEIIKVGEGTATESRISLCRLLHSQLRLGQIGTLQRRINQDILLPAPLLVGMSLNVVNPEINELVPLALVDGFRFVHL